MRLEILRQTSIAGQPARVGDVVEVSDRDVRLLIGSGKAQLAPAAVPEVQPLAMRAPSPGPLGPVMRTVRML